MADFEVPFRHRLLIRMPAAKGSNTAELSNKVFSSLKEMDASAELRRTEFVGPQVGDELAADGLKALAFVVVGIMIYLAMRFEWKFAVAAIIANLHDVVIILGFFAFFQWSFRCLCWLLCWPCLAIR